MTRATATLTGFTAVLLWALLALFTVGSAPVPPLQLNAVCFAIGGAIGVVWLIWKGDASRLRQVPAGIYVFGILCIFGYHALYFTALRLAPPAEAGLIAYLWPLFIVLFSGLLPGERVTALHLVGAVVAFIGAGLIVSGGGAAQFDPASLPGLALAFLCALTWSSYSVLSRRFGTAPTETVAVFCVGAALLSIPLHVLVEDTVWPSTSLGWASVLALGAGPVGLAFYVWDIGVKRGDIQLLGVTSYAAPLLSTLALVIFGVSASTPTLVLSAALIAGGAGIAALGSARRHRAARSEADGNKAGLPTRLPTE